jgi:PAS domain S-box-containing protein
MGSEARRPFPAEQRPLDISHTTDDLTCLPGRKTWEAGTLDAMLAASPDLVYLCDRPGTFLYANNAGARHWGKTRDELLGMAWHELNLPADVLATLSAQRQSVFDTGRALVGELTLPESCGAGTWETLLTPIQGDAAGVEVVVVALRDVTGRKHAERALGESEEKYRLLAENSTDMISRHDPEGRYLYVSPACKTLTGYEPHELIGHSAYEFILTEDQPEISTTHTAVLHSSDTYTVTFRARRRDGRIIWLESTARTIRDRKTGQVTEIHCVSRDVTERKRGEEQLRRQNLLLQEAVSSERAAHDALKRAEGQLVQAEKLSALGQMVAGVAHEINNPLAFVTSDVSVLRREVGHLREFLGLYRETVQASPSERERLLATIRERSDRIDLPFLLENLDRLMARSTEGLKRIRQIVNNLRDFARLDEAELKEADLNAGIASTVNLIQVKASAQGVELISDLAPLPRVSCYPGKINQVVLNLLSNAIDACPNGGTVTVVSRALPIGVEIRVSDTGHGIDPKIRDKIFDPFFTTKPIGQGTGLGLSISYGIIQTHGGRIDVDSEPGRGSCFTVTLPLAIPARDHESPA